MERTDAVRRPRERRTLALLRAAAIRCSTPERARDWLHAPWPELGGLTPAAAAWLSDTSARLALRILETTPAAPPARTAERDEGAID